MLNSIFILAVSLVLVIGGATLATKYATKLAQSFRLSKYTVGFIIVAIISILPETFISINAAIAGEPSFGLGMLFGSNVADLTLVFAIIILATGRNLKIESKILKNHVVYPLLLLLPLILGLNGHFSRAEGLALIVMGCVFYYISFKNGINDKAIPPVHDERIHNSFRLLLSMGLLLVGAHFTVESATALAGMWGVNPILIGMLVVGLGTIMPELFFSLKSARKKDDSLAVGDILGTVLADATIVVGILALLNPFSFPQKIVYVTGTFMVIASFILFHCMRTGKTLSRRESLGLFMFWLIFVLVEFIVNK